MKVNIELFNRKATKIFNQVVKYHIMNSEEKTVATIEFETFLESIGGLENGYYTDKPPILERGFFSVGDGWLPLVQQCIIDCIEAGWDKQICQVKEKFSGLRMYINAGSDEIHNIISKAETKSYEICETCGESAEPRKDIGWMLTLCDKHHEEIKLKIENQKSKNN